MKQRKLIEVESCFFEKNYKTDKTLARLIKKGKRKHKDPQYQNEMWDITTDFTDI